MAFKTKLDFSSNRQVKQHEATMTVLSGGTSFGLTFSALTSGPDLTTSGVSENYTSIVSTFSGNDTTTIFTWYDPRMELAINTLSAITPSNSGITQNTGQVYAPSSVTTIDGNIVSLAYTGVSFDINDIQMVELSPMNYSGTMLTYILDVLTASTLDFTGRTIWNDVSGITRTERLIITKDAQPNYIYVCSDTEGMGGWMPASGVTSGNTLHWYAENVAAPTTAPIATGAGSIALGDGAEALASGMFVYGNNAGVNATIATNSNFIGDYAGYQATGATIFSNFIGYEAGNGAYNARDCNFIGQNAGSGGHDSSYSNFIGNNAGSGAINSSSSNFIGNAAGYTATGSNVSNFIGNNAGEFANDSSSSNFIGNQAGNDAINSNESNFIGNQAGYQATGVTGSNFIGVGAGNSASDSSYSNFIGSSAGNIATLVANSNFIGVEAGSQASGSSFSNFIGIYAGNNASGSSYSNFIGNQAGNDAINSNESNFIGNQAGYQATGVTGSNFIGVGAGNSASDSSYSNFIGSSAGNIATLVANSNFIGVEAGSQASGSSFSNFIGIYAGNNASGSSYSNFIGNQAGNDAINSNESNFIGNQAGYQATGVTGSNFIGVGAGNSASDSSYSNFIGYKTGPNFIANNVGNNNIIIGTNISLPNATADAINIGGVLFGTGTYSTTIGNPSIVPANGKIGINVVTPTEDLDVLNNARFRNIGSTASAGSLYYTATGVLSTAVSDARMKTNINPLTNSLDKVKALRGVTYNWLSEPDGALRMGFIAQEVKNVVPELTFVNNNTPEKYMGVHYDNITALLVEAVKELASNTTNINTQTILAEDNNIELNYSGNQQTAIGGGISVLHGMGTGLSSDLKTDVDGNWITNNDFKSKALTIPTYTPTSSNDTSGNEGNITRDDNYLYIKTINGWKRTNLESF